MAAAAVRMIKMKRKSIVAANKKGLNYYSPLIAIMGILILGAILSNLFVKQNRLASEFDLGREQFRVLLAHSSAEKALLFVDNAARLSLEQAAYNYGKNGLYSAGSPCGSSGAFNYWTKDVILPKENCVPRTIPCYPDKNNPDPNIREAALLSFFRQTLSSFVNSFNDKSGLKVEDSSVSIPFSYEEFTLSPVAGRTEIIGKSKEPITITAAKTNKLVYEIKPSFRQSILVDVIANGDGVVSNSMQLAKISESATKEKLKGFSDPGKLKWNLDSYTKAPRACTYDTGITCKYVCDQICSTSEVCSPGEGENAAPSCHKETTCVPVYCDGTYKRTTSYDEFSSLVSSAEKDNVLVNSPATNKPEFKNLEYDFGLSWIETTGSSDTCTA